jgi:hypothetical protein
MNNSNNNNSNINSSSSGSGIDGSSSSSINGSSIKSNPLIKLGVVSSAVSDLVHGYDTLLETLPSVAEKVNQMSIGIITIIIITIIIIIIIIINIIIILLLLGQYYDRIQIVAQLKEVCL